MSAEDVRVLLRRLRRLGSETAAQPATPGVGRTPENGLGEMISEEEARAALERAAAEPRRRLRRRAEGLPDSVVKVVGDVAEH
jgi:hypothetical protein